MTINTNINSAHFQAIFEIQNRCFLVNDKKSGEVKDIQFNQLPLILSIFFLNSGFEHYIIFSS